VAAGSGSADPVTTKRATATKTTTKGKGKAKSKSKSKSATNEDTPAPAAETQALSLDDQFYHMIHDDHAFWVRVLRYEPIAFDELVSMALQRGIKGRGWKDELKQFLDARVSRAVWPIKLAVALGSGRDCSL
jgi:hypothetical protein